MFIHGIIIPSTLDEIGKVSATIFTIGCNFNCIFCHNSELISRKVHPLYRDDEVIEMIRKSRTIDCVVLSGGEPLLQEDIYQFIVKLKKARD